MKRELKSVEAITSTLCHMYMLSSYSSTASLLCGLWAEGIATTVCDIIMSFVLD